MSYLKACCLHDTCSMRMQGNWDRITKKYGGTQQGGFIRYVLTLVNLPPILFPNPAPCYSHQSAEPPCFLVISLPPMRRQQSSPASLPHARSPNSRGRWSRASRTCGPMRGGSRASGASPGLLRRCRSCCTGPDLPSVGLQGVWLVIRCRQMACVCTFSVWKRLSLVVFSAPCKSIPSPSRLVKEGSRFEHRHGLKKNFDLYFFTIKNYKIKLIYTFTKLYFKMNLFTLLSYFPTQPKRIYL